VGVICGSFSPCLSALAWAVIVGSCGMSAEDGCGRLSSFAVVSCDDDER
jgi:hypothetical protein